MTATLSAPQSIESWLGEEGEDLLTYKAKVSKDLLHLPGPDFIERIWSVSDRSTQVLNCYCGRVGLINSGGASGKHDFAEAIRTAVINKRAGGTGLISGRKTFQRPFEEGVKLFHAIQDVYLSPDVTLA